MKYIITESNLDNVVSMYLDKQDFVLYDNKKKYNNYIYFLNDAMDEVAQISVYSTNAFGEVRNWVFVNSELIQELSDFFSINEPKSLEFVRKWVSKIFNVEISLIETSRNDNYHRLEIKK